MTRHVKMTETRQLRELVEDLKLRPGCDPCAIASKALALAIVYEGLLAAIYDNRSVLATVCGNLPDVYASLREMFGHNGEAHD